MPGPKLGCGGAGQPACPPENAAATYSTDDMQAHGLLNYQKGRKEQAESILAVIDDPSHGWSEGEMARAIRAVIS